jgi:hypothetical protein
MKQRDLAFLPTAAQEQLLKACLRTGDLAVDAWESWRQSSSLDDIDYASQRLLPLLYHNLRSLQIKHPDLKRYESAYRHAWFQNQMAWRAARVAINALDAAGIPSMTLKGMAMASLYYGNMALRPMHDIDLMVRDEKLERIVATLEEIGWKIKPSTAPQGCWRDYVLVANEMSLCNEGGQEIDLHWHLQYEYCRNEIDERFWSRSRMADINGMPARTISDTHHLVHTCIHGAKWDEVRPIRWVADGCKILGSAQIDWVEVLHLARSYEMKLPIRDTLRYLKDVFECEVPGDVLAELELLPESPDEQFQYRILQLAKPYSPLLALRMRFRHYRHVTNGQPTLYGFIGYLKASYGESSLLALVNNLMRRALPRIGGFLLRQSKRGGGSQPLERN